MRAVLLAHGSPDPRSSAAVRAAAARLGRRTGREVVAAFLDHDEPRLVDAVEGTGAGDGVDVLPLLLSRAFHARVDVPAAVAALRRPVRLLDPLGHPQPLLEALLDRTTDPVVVVAAGTRADDEREHFSTVVRAAARRTGRLVAAAFATGPGPGTADSVLALGTRAVILPWLLAPGRLLDAVVGDAGPGGVLAADGLLAEPALDDVLAVRLALDAGPG